MAEADLIIGLCDRFHCLPSQIENESAYLLTLLAIQAEGTPEKNYDYDEDEE